MGWFNFYGAAVMAAMLIPNVIYAARCRDGFENFWQNRVVALLERIGRFGCLALMIFNIPHTYGGFWFDGARALYMAGNAGLLAAYCLIWVVCFRRVGVFRAAALSALPSAMFLLSGVCLSSWPLLVAAAVFAPCHILISVKNAFLAAK